MFAAVRKCNALEPQIQALSDEGPRERVETYWGAVAGGHSGSLHNSGEVLPIAGPHSAAAPYSALRALSSSYSRPAQGPQGLQAGQANGGH